MWCYIMMQQLEHLVRVAVFLRPLFFFFQAEDGIRDLTVTGVQTCALPILAAPGSAQCTGQSRCPPPAQTSAGCSPAAPTAAGCRTRWAPSPTAGTAATPPAPPESCSTTGATGPPPTGRPRQCDSAPAAGSCPRTPPCTASPSARPPSRGLCLPRGDSTQCTSPTREWCPDTSASCTDTAPRTSCTPGTGSGRSARSRPPAACRWPSGGTLPCTPDTCSG